MNCINKYKSIDRKSPFTIQWYKGLNIFHSCMYEEIVSRSLASLNTVFFDIARYGLTLSLPACLFVGINTFASGLFTAFSNGAVSFALSMIRTFFVLTVCLYGLTAVLGGTGLWLAWPVAEVISFVITLFTLRHYQGKYLY